MSWMSTIVAVVMATCTTFIGCAASAANANPPIAFKYTEIYEGIWDDYLFGGFTFESIGSFWRPVEYEPYYYTLGDTANVDRSRPATGALVVKALDPNALAQPKSFTEIWSTKGGLFLSSATVFRMNPPNGYRCLGYAVMPGRSDTPSKSKYRCVKSSFVTTGAYSFMFNDKGSNADKDLAVYRNAKADSLYGIEANTFSAFKEHSRPDGSPNILDGRHAKLNSLIQTPVEKKPLKVYRGDDLDEIWNDEGSGADRDVGIWRSEGPSGTYSLGDIAAKHYKEPQASFVVKDSSPGGDALRAPYDYHRVWNDRGSDADDDVAIWEPNCPSGYRALGFVARDHRSRKPSVNSMRCVHSNHSRLGSWDLVWKDRGSDADEDVSIWKAVTDDQEGLSINAMAAVDKHDEMNRRSYVLKTSSVEFLDGKPAKRYVLSGIVYDFGQEHLLGEEPDNLFRTTVINNGNTTQVVSREISLEYTETYDWSYGSSLEIGVTLEVSGGIPSFGEASVSTSITRTFSTEVGESTSVTKSDSTTANVEVQPKSQKDVTIVATRYKATVPYTATLVTVYSDGTTGTRTSYQGVLYGVQVSQVTTVYEESIPLPP